MTNTQPQHTAGPWYAHGCYVSGGIHDTLIASVSYRGGVDLSEAEANARLIASAPEMLEALQGIITAYLQGVITATDTTTDTDTDKTQMARAIKQGLTAIEKAKGEV